MCLCVFSNKRIIVWNNNFKVSRSSTEHSRWLMVEKMFIVVAPAENNEWGYLLIQMSLYPKSMYWFWNLFFKIYWIFKLDNHSKKKCTKFNQIWNTVHWPAYLGYHYASYDTTINFQEADYGARGEETTLTYLITWLS